MTIKTRIFGKKSTFVLAQLCWVRTVRGVALCECLVACWIHVYVCELCYLFVPILWDVRREGLKVRHTFNCWLWNLKSLFYSQDGQAILLDMKYLWLVQPKVPPQNLLWPCYTLPSKHQFRLKGPSGSLTVIHWLLYHAWLYWASSGTIIVWLHKESTVHVWIATLFGS